MANLATLKAALNAAIYQNTQNAITGEALNTILNSIIDTLGTGYRYAGVATPSANPGTIDNRVFYLATAAGTYTNFGAVQLDGKSLHIFIYDTTWHNIALDVPTTAALAVVAGSSPNSIKGKDAGCHADADGAVAVGYATNGDGSISTDAEGGFANGFAEETAQISASGYGAHAEGYAEADSSIQAAGDGSHAEGATSYDGNILAEGLGSHAEGSGSTASGACSHAEGVGTIANGVGSHAEGIYTKTQNDGETAIGKCNLSNKATTGTDAQKAALSTLFSIGCGANKNSPKNALEVMQNGDLYVKGVAGYDGENIGSPGVGPITKLLNYAIFFASPGESPRDWAGQPIVVAANEFAFIVVADQSKRTSLFSQYLQDALENAGVSSPVIDNCVYIGVDGSTVINSSDLLEQGTICCIYYDEPNDEYHFIEYEY